MQKQLPVIMHKCGDFVHAPIKRTTFLCWTCLHQEKDKTKYSKIINQKNHPDANIELNRLPTRPKIKCLLLGQSNNNGFT